MCVATAFEQGQQRQKLGVVQLTVIVGELRSRLQVVEEGLLGHRSTRDRRIGRTAVPIVDPVLPASILQRLIVQRWLLRREGVARARRVRKQCLQASAGAFPEQGALLQQVVVAHRIGTVGQRTGNEGGRGIVHVDGFLMSRR